MHSSSVSRVTKWHRDKTEEYKLGAIRRSTIVIGGVGEVHRVLYVYICLQTSE